MFLKSSRIVVAVCSIVGAVSLLIPDVATAAEVTENADSVKNNIEICEAQNLVENDSVPFVAEPLQSELSDKRNSLPYKVAKKDFYRILYAGAPLVVSGIALRCTDENFKSFRNEYAKTYKYPYDDYVQYSPAVAMLAMKAFGVESRSSWGRMLTSDAFSMVIMAGVVNAVKESVRRMRPDGSNHRSFPSGHTATAFMCATMLHKEYGHISPWISVGGYTVATATGLSRILNNKHWASDVLVGAGIGILSTEIGYFLTDLIFKGKGLSHFELPERYDRLHNPSFLGLYMGYGLSGTKYQTSVGELSSGLGLSIGLEGAYFFNPYIGVGGKGTFTDMPLKVNGEMLPYHLEMNSVSAGVHLSYPFSSLVHISAKVLGGFNHYSKCRRNDTAYWGGNNTAVLTAGGAVVFVVSKAFNGRIFCDYSTSGSFVKNSDQNFNTVTIGGVFGVNF